MRRSGADHGNSSCSAFCLLRMLQLDALFDVGQIGIGGSVLPSSLSIVLRADSLVETPCATSRARQLGFSGSHPIVSCAAQTASTTTSVDSAQARYLLSLQRFLLNDDPAQIQTLPQLPITRNGEEAYLAQVQFDPP